MRLLFSFLLSILSLSSEAQLRNPFSTLKFDKVLFYDFEEAADKIYKGSILTKDGKPIQRITKQVELSGVMIKALNSKLGDKKSYGQGTAACFDPHCGFDYFLKEIPVAQITICLGCNGLHSSLDIPAQKQGKLGQGANTYFFLSGMSKSMRKFINGLVIENQFNYQIKPGSVYDK
ncbi:hypothetical protein ACFST9_15170 [Hymenobacter monticola]|uniref:Rieske domain-containing protein n=1 Tax=Hymenobacter monticola TaxID=1705399 RepID=A0ABY4B1S4_9BACT|nr:hypothetical protein [Hymenobacter monticola]UOE32744.1 hypothetical protein MTP16_16605 [Hymenobacter monticola]